MKNKIIIIGAGIGGLATAALLAKDGYKITIIEKNSQIGGRARQLNLKGFKFDMGPSWYMMPDAFERYFSHFDKKPSDFYQLEKLNPHYTVYFDNNRQYSIYPDLEKNIDLFEKTESGSGEKLKLFLQQTKYLYEKSMQSLVFFDYNSFLPLLNPDILINLPRMNLFTSFHAQVKKYFKNPDLQKIVEFTTVFLGGSPYNTPAFYTLIAHTDFNLKIWYPKGGMIKIVQALEKLCRQYNVKIITNQQVIKIITDNNKAISVMTKNDKYNGDVVISNADMHYTETNLIDKQYQTYPDNYWQKKILSPSAFIIYLGINKKLKNIAHHCLYFSNTWEKHFDTVYQKSLWPENPSYYVHIPSVTDNNLAPRGKETLMFLVPVASGLVSDKKFRMQFAQKIIKHFEKLIGQKFSNDIIVRKIFSHQDFISDYNSYQGTAFGLAHTLFQTGPFRPKNKSKKLPNLYYVGQYTNPGIGVPVCLISSQIVINLIKKYA